MEPVWANEIYIATAPAATVGGEPTWSKLCAGIDGMTFNSNEQNQQYFFLCGFGVAHNEVTGSAPELQITGRREVGDAAQDYIASKQFALGEDRNSQVKIIASGKQIVCDCSIGDVVSFGGNTLDVNNFSCTIRFNGAPTVTDAA